MTSKAPSSPLRTRATSRSSGSERASRDVRGTAMAIQAPLTRTNARRRFRLAGCPAGAESTLEHMPSFEHDGHRLAYTEHGEGDRTVVLLHGLLLSQRMHEPLA